MKSLNICVGSLTLRATAAHKIYIEAWFEEQKKAPQACGSLDQWASDLSTRFFEVITKHYGEADSVTVGWSETGDLLLVAMAENNCEAFCATVPAGSVPPVCDYCGMQAAMDRINVTEIGYA